MILRKHGLGDGTYAILKLFTYTKYPRGGITIYVDAEVWLITLQII